MLKKLLVIGFVCAAVYTRAEEGKKIASKVQKVIVFLNGAQVTRTATVNIVPGKSTLVFDNISPGIDPQSIQVHAGGDFTILSVNNELNYLNAASRVKDIDKLRDAQKVIGDKLTTARNDLSVQQEEEAMLLKNQQVKGDNANLDVVKLKEALDFQTLRLSAIRKKETIINADIAVMNEQYQDYDSQISELNRGDAKVTGNIVVTISSKMALQSDFTLNYLVHNASWYPTYDIRAKNVNSPLDITYKANVSQHSGEDWDNIKLTLSTGNPSTSGSKPELTPYFLNFYNSGYNNYQADKITAVTGTVTDRQDGTPIPGVTIRVNGTSIGTSTNSNGMYSISVPNGNSTLSYSFIGYETQQLTANSSVLNVSMQASSKELGEVVVTTGYGVRKPSRSMGYSMSTISNKDLNQAAITGPMVNQVENQTNVEFNIADPYTIPSDGKQITVQINDLNIAASYEYAVAPKLSTDVFLSAKLIGWNKYNFLPGEANLFFEGTFIGKSLMNANSTNDTLNISLGADKNIVVTRTLQKEFTQKQIIGSDKKDTRDWIIEVKNRKNQPINLQVEDQIPVSQNSAIEVQAQQLSGASLDAGTGKVNWNIMLKPQENKKLELNYQVKYPKAQPVIIE